MAKYKTKLIVGQDYLTRGGWKVRAIWENKTGIEGFWMIHRPGEGSEMSIPVLHNSLGKAPDNVGSGQAPAYGLHPADVVDVWNEPENSGKIELQNGTQVVHVAEVCMSDEGCEQCGRCCFPVTMPVKLDPEADYENIPEGFVESSWHLFGIAQDHFLYGCDHYDQDTKLCKIYDHKPKICTSFPVNEKECYAKFPDS